MTDIPADVLEAAAKVAHIIAAGVIGDGDSRYVETSGAKDIARAIIRDRAAQAERMARLEGALRPFAMTAASDEEIAAMQEEIVPGVMAVVFAAKLDEVMSARRALSQEGSNGAAKESAE